MKTSTKWLAVGLVAGSAAGALLHYKLKNFIPEGIKPVKDFVPDNFLGTWHEIARFDYRFEKNLHLVTAKYSLNADGSLKVKNRGYNVKTNQWKEANGIAKFTGDTGTASLKVSFFGPFYSGYNVIAITPDYRHALICGESREYLWILSRDKEMPDFVIKPFLEYAESLGFDTEALTWPRQDLDAHF